MHVMKATCVLNESVCLLVKCTTEKNVFNAMALTRETYRQEHTCALPMHMTAVLQSLFIHTRITPSFW